MLNYVPRWWPSWIFNRSIKEQHLVSSLQWSFMTIFISILHVVSEKIFEISANHILLWTLKAILDNRLEQKSNNKWPEPCQEHICQVWFQSILWFLRRSLLYIFPIGSLCYIMSPASGHLGFSIGPKSDNTLLAACYDHSWQFPIPCSM
jgi:hypothetical protein